MRNLRTCRDRRLHLLFHRYHHVTSYPHSIALHLSAQQCRMSSLAHDICHHDKCHRLCLTTHTVFSAAYARSSCMSGGFRMFLNRILIAACVVAITIAAQAQQCTPLTGVIKDPTGAVIADATLTVDSNPAVVSDAQGRFS